MWKHMYGYAISILMHPRSNLRTRRLLILLLPHVFLLFSMSTVARTLQIFVISVSQMRTWDPRRASGENPHGRRSSRKPLIKIIDLGYFQHPFKTCSVYRAHLSTEGNYRGGRKTQSFFSLNSFRSTSSDSFALISVLLWGFSTQITMQRRN